MAAEREPHRHEASEADVGAQSADVVEIEPDVGHHQAPAGERVIERTLYVAGEKPVPFEGTQLRTLVGDDRNVAWIDLSGYTREDLEDAAGQLGIGPPVVRDILAAWSRPRVAIDGECFFVAVTVAGTGSDRRVVASQLDLVLGPNFVLTAHKGPIDFMEEVRERAGASPELLDLHSAFLLYIILDRLLGHYEKVFEGLEDEIERMEERALHDSSESYLEELLKLKRYVFALGRLAEQHRPVLTRFTEPDFPGISGDHVERYFWVLQDRLNHLLGRLFAAREAVNGAFEIHVSHLAHRTNAVIKALTLISALIFPLTLITGFFSTNFGGRLASLHGEGGFVVMVVVMVLTLGGILFYLRGRGWI